VTLGLHKTAIPMMNKCATVATGWEGGFGCSKGTTDGGIFPKRFRNRTWGSMAPTSRGSVRGNGKGRVAKFVSILGKYLQIVEDGRGQGTMLRKGYIDAERK
jgi:hypothetical protein